MSNLENNAYFWQKLETIYAGSDFVVTQEIGSVHPRYTSLVYPVRYGILRSYDGDQDTRINAFKGKNGTSLETIIVCADILTKEVDVKLLIGCNKEEEEAILRFLNQTDFQKTIVVRKGSEIPAWTDTEN
ncbi:MAG: Inorganic pyrophosphatase [Erysipelotrichaceae bacterium]|jgi:inorganic pyrophosphatase|nr:Inorganic pyrophosphatase [Erysipelotrichaceae bacterium]MBR2809124.1 Inorganic pyrophosphatase [Erysipelotrichaceae bacterium]